MKEFKSKSQCNYCGSYLRHKFTEDYPECFSVFCAYCGQQQIEQKGESQMKYLGYYAVIIVGAMAVVAIFAAIILWSIR